jgi:putative oxidoreductase
MTKNFIQHNNNQHMKWLLITGRVFFVSIFILTSLDQFSAQSIAYAASKGVPLASVVVPFAGIIEIVGAISIIFGYRVRIGALLLIIFLIPVTFTFHQFWTIQDQMAKEMDMINFFKNISILGGALIITYFGAGELSLDKKSEETGIKSLNLE